MRNKTKGINFQFQFSASVVAKRFSRNLPIQIFVEFYVKPLNVLLLFLLFFPSLQVRLVMVVMVPRPMRSYFHSATKKVLDHLRAWWRPHHMQFTVDQLMVQHLVQGGTSTSLTMPTVTLIQAQSLAAITLFQLENKTRQQSWLGLTNSHLMRWRCFILAEAVSSYD